jgi:hypothetical protein
LGREGISSSLKNVKKTEEHNKRVSDAVKKAWKEGTFNDPQTVENKRIGYANRKSTAGKNNPMYGKPCPNKSGRGKGGIRKDLGHYVRSSWEANVCRVCKYVNREYEFEKHRFEVIIDGVEATYCPDLFFPKNMIYYEIKGHAKSSQEWVCTCESCVRGRKLVEETRKKYGIKIILIGKYEYKRYIRWFSKKIETWEKSR